MHEALRRLNATSAYPRDHTVGVLRAVAAVLCASYVLYVFYGALIGTRSGVSGFSCLPSPDAPVCVVDQVTPGLAADAAGIEVGDSIVAVDGQYIDHFSRDIGTWLDQQPAGASFSLGISPGPSHRQPCNCGHVTVLLTLQPFAATLAGSDVFRLETIARVSELWEWTVTGAVFLGLAVLLIWMRPGSVPARLMFLAGSGLAFAFLGNAGSAPLADNAPAPQIRVLIMTLSAVGAVIGLPALVHLFMLFPNSTPLHARVRALGSPPVVASDWVPYAYAAATLPLVFAVAAWSPFLRLDGSLLYHSQLAWAFYGTLLVLMVLGPIALRSLLRRPAASEYASALARTRWISAIFFGVSMAVFLPLTFLPAWVSFVNPEFIQVPLRVPLLRAIFFPYSGWYWNTSHVPVGLEVLPLAILWPVLWLAIGGGPGLLYSLSTAVVGFGLIALPRYLALYGLAFTAALLLILTLWSVAYNFRYPTTLTTRTQVRWVMASLVVVSLGSLLLSPAATLLENSWEGPGWLLRTALNMLLPVLWVLFPVATVLSILRYRLFDLDVIVNKAVVFAILTIILVTLFMLLSALSHVVVTRVLGLDPGVLESVNAVATALAFEPVRRRTQVAVDQLLPSSANLALLFLDIVGSTERAARIGDAAWRDLLERFRTAVRRVVRRYAGREVHAAGDGFFVAFESAQACLACAVALPPEVRRVGLAIRTGMHFGPCETRGEDLSGLHVHIAARIMAMADADEILISEPLAQALQPGEGHFSFRGEHVLKGVPGRWNVYAVDPAIAVAEVAGLPVDTLAAQH